MSERLDVEEDREITTSLFAHAARIVSRYEGRVDKLMGDTVSPCSVPVTTEMTRARPSGPRSRVHAVIDKVDARHGSRIGQPLAMRSGVNRAWWSPVSRRAGTPTSPTGDTVNVAARLASLSQDGEILVGPATAPGRGPL